ncbi:FUSC family protein [Dongshaea marina]|uniref:FUSC family protein n=1 Tax=Dongshaea marina TaxID=2047966 RepID=UPI000D3EB8C6|nr:FUSC family protein [Dongshaea marina]
MANQKYNLVSLVKKARINHSDLLYLVIALLPSIAEFYVQQQERWLLAGLVTTSIFIVQRRLRWGLLPSLGHGLLIACGFALLYYSQCNLILFALITALFAMALCSISHFGNSLHALSSFTILPVIYLACGFYPAPTELHLINHNFLQLAATFPLAIGSAFIPLILQYICRGFGKKALMDMVCGYHHRADPPETHILVTAIGVFVAVFIAALWVKWLLPAHGEWLIWSVVSIHTGERVSMHSKVRHRFLGATIGPGLGYAIIHSIPKYPLFHHVAVLLIPLTLVAFDCYPLAFTLRSMLHTVDGMNLGQDDILALARSLNVLIGSGFGILICYLAEVVVVRYLRQHTFRKVTA